MPTHERRPDVETLEAVIACSQIVLTPVLAPISASGLARDTARLAARWRLPVGFDAVDVAVLEWIACEARRLGLGGGLIRN